MEESISKMRILFIYFKPHSSVEKYVVMQVGAECWLGPETDAHLPREGACPGPASSPRLAKDAWPQGAARPDPDGHGRGPQGPHVPGAAGPAPPGPAQAGGAVAAADGAGGERDARGGGGWSADCGVLGTGCQFGLHRDGAPNQNGSANEITSEI